MKKLNVLLAIMIMAAAAVGQSVGINDDGSAPDASAILDLKSSDKGLLLPRVSSPNSISNPAMGLVIFCLSCGENGQVLVYNGTEWTTFNGEAPVRPEIGDYYRGGVVFHIFESGEQGYVENELHGLICAIVNQSESSSQWGCAGTSIGTTQSGVGYGAQNTTAIENGCSTNLTAADICANLILNGYSDWFLPSIDELGKMYINRAAINATSVANGGDNFITDTPYWSSTEKDADNAWYKPFSNGVTGSWPKEGTFSVRAVRAF